MECVVPSLQFCLFIMLEIFASRFSLGVIEYEKKKIDPNSTIKEKSMKIYKKILPMEP